MDFIRATLSAKNVHIFSATESWLTESHPDHLIAVEGYNIFRNDRDDGRVGGGVVVWVNFCMQPIVFKPHGNPYGTNSVWLLFPSMNLSLISIYIPPSSSVHFSSDVINFISNNLDQVLIKYPNIDIQLMGDFNRIDTTYLQSSFDIRNVVNEPTRGDAMLDLVFLSTSLVDDYLISVGPPVGSSDHRTVLCTPKTKIPPADCKIQAVYDLRDSHVNDFLSKLNAVNFFPLYDMNLSLDDKCRIFNDCLWLCFVETIPCQYVTMTPRDKPYVTPLIKLLINQRWSAYRQRHFERYQRLSMKVKQLLLKEKKRWALKSEKGSKEMWQVVNECRGTKSSRDNAIFSLVNSFPSPSHAVEELNSTFISFQSARPVPVIPNSNNHEVHQNWPPDISVTSVRDLILKMKPNKAPGFGDVPGLLYKKSADIISAPLTHLICVSIMNSQYPSPWKTSLITPVPKSQPISKDNLRPISLLPALSKVCEKAVLNSGIATKLRENFGRFQFGNIPGSSTTTAHICLHDFITTLLDKKSTLGVLLLAYDFTKAFDQLGHDVIIKTLADNSFPLPFIRWIADYLNDRKQMVKIFNSVSKPLLVNSGVPQGSVLGPFLFNLVMGSLKPLKQSTHIIKFVDDCTFVIPVIEGETSNIIIQEHQNMKNWSSSVGLQLNLAKCKSLWIPKSTNCTVPDIPNVTASTEVKILGVTFTQSLKWDRHFQNINKIASRRLYALRVLRPLLDPPNLARVYYGLIRSVIEYVSPLFIGMLSKNQETVDRIQRRAHRIVCKNCHQCHCNFFPSLKSRREQAAIKLLIKASSDSHHILHALCPQLSNRSGKLIQPVSLTSRRINSFFPKTTMLLNGTFID